MAAGSGVIDLEMALHCKTRAAVRVSGDGDDRRAVWLPASLIEIAETGRLITGIESSGQTVKLPLVTVTLPQWLAADKGLI
jgi:hypothetical protein